MSWVKQYKLPAVEAIWYQGLPCNSLPDLRYALHLSYNLFIFLFFCSKIYNAVLDRSPWQTIYNK